MRTLAVGDIHGCGSALDALLDALALKPDDFLVFLGDYIDRGIDSKGVVSRLINLTQQRNAIALRGNHEVMILSAREDPLQAKLWGSYGGDAALRSYGAGFRDDWQRFVPDSHWAFFEETKPWFETETHIFVHATVLADVEMKDQPDAVLYWERYDHRLHHKSNKIVVCGHTPQRGGWPAQGEFSVCIDTGAGAGEWLTCLDVDSGRVWQANQCGALRTGELKPFH